MAHTAPCTPFKSRIRLTYGKAVLIVFIGCLFGYLIISMYLEVRNSGKTSDVKVEKLLADRCNVRRSVNLDVTVSPKLKSFTKSPEKLIKIMIDITHAFTNAMKANNISYHMTAGTLLGSYIHHGIIPWDDDLDFVVLEQERAKVKRAIDALLPKFQSLALPKEGIWRFYSAESTRIKNKKYKWATPYLDVHFHNYEKPPHKWKKYYNKSIVFPYVERPFLDMILPCPNKPELFLQFRYKLDKCPTNGFNHTTIEKIPKDKQVMLPCSDLYNKFPFVFRCTSPSGKVVNETLWIGDRMLSWVAIKEGHVVEQWKQP